MLVEVPLHQRHAAPFGEGFGNVTNGVGAVKGLSVGVWLDGLYRPSGQPLLPWPIALAYQRRPRVERLQLDVDEAEVRQDQEVDLPLVLVVTKLARTTAWVPREDRSRRILLKNLSS